MKSAVRLVPYRLRSRAVILSAAKNPFPIETRFAIPRIAKNHNSFILSFYLFFIRSLYPCNVRALTERTYEMN